MDFLPTPRPGDKQGAFDDKTRVGLFVGFHMQPGGRWSGDYLVVEFARLRESPNTEPGSAKIHRVAEVMNVDFGKFVFPLGEYRLAKEAEVVVTTEVPEQGGSTPGQIPVLTEPQDSSRKREAEAPGGLGAGRPDLRGQGGVVDGRPVRRYKGSKRPPYIDPDVWSQLLSPKEREELTRS